MPVNRPGDSTNDSKKRSKTFGPDGSYQEQIARASLKTTIPKDGESAAVDEKNDLYGGDSDARASTKNEPKDTNDTAKDTVEDLNKQINSVNRAQNIQDQSSDRTLREKLVKKVTSMTRIWVWAVIGITLLRGWQVSLHFESTWLKFVSVRPFYVPDGVLIAFISATGVFGVIGIILNGLFRDRHKKSAEDSR